MLFRSGRGCWLGSLFCRYAGQYVPECADRAGQRLLFWIANQERHHFAKPLAPLTDKWWLGNYLFECHLRLQSRFFILPQVTSARREPVSPQSRLSQTCPPVVTRGIHRRWGRGRFSRPAKWQPEP